MDRGTVARCYTNAHSDMPMALYANPHRGSLLPPAFQNQSASISGVVSDASGPRQFARVTLHWSQSMKCIGITWSDEDGAYSFTGLVYGQQYTVFCDSPPGSPLYHALAHAKVIAL